MTLLQLWGVSVSLALFSLAIMAGLIIARFFAERRGKRLRAARARLMPWLLDPSTAVPDLGRGGLSRNMLADLTVELIQLVRGEDRDNFVAAAVAFGVADTLRHRLFRGSARTSAVAAEALTHFPGDRATLELERALDHRSSDVRLAAALALAASDRAPPVRELIAHLELGTSETSLVIATLFQKMAEHNPDEIESLLSADDISPAVKFAAIEGLRSIRGFALAPLVNDLVLQFPADSPDLPQFLRALGSFQHPAGIPGVRRHLDSPTWWVRAAAAEAAGRIGMTDSGLRLTSMLGDPDWWVRFRAGEALVRLGQSGQALLRQSSQSATELERTAAQLTLAEHGIVL